MKFYKKELDALKRANIFRKRTLYSEELNDFASNDYLGLSSKKSLFKKACKKIKKYKFHASKASTLVNGYHPVHQEFEEYISKRNSFEKALVMGSGFLANLSIFESLPRRGDLLLFDEEYHASGLIATNLNDAKVLKFPHNNPQELEKIIKEHSYNRLIIAVEGVYSMSGDILKREFFDIAKIYEAILVVDEAHSVGVVGDNLLGVFEHYGITPQPNHIKMGTLGKALGSYGAYILSSNEIYEFLCNRAKALIYATAPSPFDIALALEGFLYIDKNSKKLSKKIDNRREKIKKALGIEIDALILRIEIGSSKRVMFIKDELQKRGFLVGAIRPPTVKKAMLRVIPRVSQKRFGKLLRLLEGIQ